MNGQEVNQRTTSPTLYQFSEVRHAFPHPVGRRGFDHSPIPRR
jgi:hypothetical protein